MKQNPRNAYVGVNRIDKGCCNLQLGMIYCYVPHRSWDYVCAKTLQYFSLAHQS